MNLENILNKYRDESLSRYYKKYANFRVIKIKFKNKEDSPEIIYNNSNDWVIEYNHILFSVISLSVATVKIVKALPKLNFEEKQA